MVTAIGGLAGRYSGRGEWHEANARTGGYEVTHAIEPREGGLRIVFRHGFDNGDPEVNAAFEMDWVTDTLFVVSSGGAPAGKGYLFDGFCHYTLELGGLVVEVSCVRTDRGLRVLGSSSRNKAGNAIAWHEELERVTE